MKRCQIIPVGSIADENEFPEGDERSVQADSVDEVVQITARCRSSPIYKWWQFDWTTIPGTEWSVRSDGLISHIVHDNVLSDFTPEAQAARDFFLEGVDERTGKRK